MNCEVFKILDGFEFSSNGFKFQTKITSIGMQCSGIRSGKIEFAIMYNLCIDVQCMGR